MRERRYRVVSPVRVWTLGRHTFTQLVRMRVFYFLLIFAALILLATYWLGSITEQGLGLIYAERFAQQVGVIKNTAFGAMRAFVFLFAIAATALLLPKDIEDRTLYTILSKPVPRHEYLAGKFLGVVLTLAVSLLVMAVMFAIAVHLRQMQMVAAETEAFRGSLPPEHLEQMSAAHRTFGLRPSLLGAVGVLWLEGAVIGAMTLLLSTFASSTLVTMIFGFGFLVAGHFPSMLARLIRQSAHPGDFGEALIRLFRTVFPNFEIYDIFDGVAAGEVLAPAVAGQIALTAVAYLVIYLTAAALIFARKEL